jgi:hypothetical protein
MERFKYCRTYHFPWSPGISSDDKIYHEPQAIFGGKECYVSIKKDGENSALYSDGYTHARSIDSQHHVSREWLKSFWAERCYELPTGWRVYGENLYAKHSIAYDNLPSYFMAFSIFDDTNHRLPLDEFLTWCELLGITPVEIVHRFVASGNWDDDVFDLFKKAVDNGEEGIVMTTVDGFHYDDFSTHLIKAVRANHVQTDEHWRFAQIQQNKLMKGTK